jgi:adenine-specific DNA-methyltransferase
MPTLHWVGKDKVVNHHHDVPFRLLDKQYTFTASEGTPAPLPKNSTANRIIHGDNLEVLKSLLPEFEGKVNCIYIDPPYNTGNEGWVYNDAVNAPKIKKWLGQVVGKEGEDLSRHDKWLCMMYPRLKLLHRLLADDGILWVTLDDSEGQYFKLLADEMFGRSNFIATFCWQKTLTRRNDAKVVSTAHDYVFCYAKNFALAKLSKQEKDKKQRDTYTNRDNDPRGDWLAVPFHAPNIRPNLTYKIITPSGKELWPPKGRCWSTTEDAFNELRADNRIYFGKDGGGMAQRKKFWAESDSDMVPWTWWTYEDAGDNREANKEIKELVGESEMETFPTPKPVKLLDRVLALSSRPDSIILDSFAGSGTTAHAVLKLNAQDGGNRRFILCEMMDYAETITAERVRRVMNGYGEGTKAVAGTGGAFDYYTVGPALFKEDKNLNEDVGAEAIRRYVSYTESIPLAQQCGTDNAVSRYALGASDTALWLFYYEQDRITTLNLDFLASLNIKHLTKRPEHFVIYADKCALDKDFLD